MAGRSVLFSFHFHSTSFVFVVQQSSHNSSVKKEEHNSNNNVQVSEYLHVAFDSLLSNIWLHHLQAEVKDTSAAAVDTKQIHVQIGQTLDNKKHVRLESSIFPLYCFVIYCVLSIVLLSLYQLGVG
jgi:hypothetical protein